MKGLDIVISHFLPQGGVEEVRPLGNGLINDTYIVKTAGSGHDYVLQRINNSIFKGCWAAAIKHRGRHGTSARKGASGRHA